MKNKITWFSSVLFSAAIIFAATSLTPYITSMLYYLFLCLTVYLLSEIIYSELNKLGEKFIHKAIPVKNREDHSP